MQEAARYRAQEPCGSKGTDECGSRFDRDIAAAAWHQALLLEMRPQSSFSIQMKFL